MRLQPVEEAASEATSADFVNLDMDVEQLEKELNLTGEEAVHHMMTNVYANMWQGSKEATIKAMVQQAEVHEIPAILEFAKTIPEDPIAA